MYFDSTVNLFRPEICENKIIRYSLITPRKMKIRPFRISKLPKMSAKPLKGELPESLPYKT